VPAVETGDLALLRGLLLDSDMLTVLSARQLHHEVRTGQLVVLPFDMPGLERPSASPPAAAPICRRARARCSRKSYAPAQRLGVSRR
jgi:hypothetical protein